MTNFLNLILDVKKYKILIFWLTYLSLISSVSSQEISTETSNTVHEKQVLTDSLTEELNTLYKRGFIKGFGVAVVDEKSTIYDMGFGYANEAQKTPYTSHSVQNIASISKTFLGLALLKAQEMGKLQLDEPINKYLPFKVHNPYYPDDVITIRQLTTHTSSIIDSKYYDKKSYILKEVTDSSNSNNMVNPGNFNDPDTAISMGEFLKNVLSEDGDWYLKKGFLKHRPGARFGYSNVGATLAAFVLEMATGESYDSFSKKHILEPLGMNDSGWSFEEINMEKHTVLYDESGKPLSFYRLITYPDGGLITSIHDMSKYLKEIILGYKGEGTLLSKESYKEFYKEQLTSETFEEGERDAENPYSDEYNMGVFMGFSAKGNIGHSGGDPGVTTLMFFNAESKIGQLFFVNSGMNQDGFQEFIDVWTALEKFRKGLELSNY